MGPELRDNLEVEELRQARWSLGFLHGEPGRERKERREASRIQRTPTVKLQIVRHKEKAKSCQRRKSPMFPTKLRDPPQAQLRCQDTGARPPQSQRKEPAPKGATELGATGL